MSTAIRYTPPSPQVTRDEVCYRTPASAEVQHGFLILTFMADEEIARRLESLAGTVVENYTLCPCPIQIQQVLNDKQVLVLRNRTNQRVVYAVNTVNDNGTVSTVYYNLDGTPYTGNINDLELAADNLNYGSPTIFCEAGINTVTRTDVWDEARNLVAVIWQDMLGVVIAEPQGVLTPGSCELPLDTEVIPQIDNILENGRASGQYVPFYRMNVYDNLGNTIYSNQALADGTAYTPQGTVTVQPIIPPIKLFNRRLTTGEIWETTPLVQSIAFAIEYANRTNVVEIMTPGSLDPVVYDKLNYEGSWSVDGDNDSFLEGLRIKANGSSKVLLTWTEQPLLMEVEPESVGSGYGGN